VCVVFCCLSLFFAHQCRVKVKGAPLKVFYLHSQPVVGLRETTRRQKQMYDPPQEGVNQQLMSARVSHQRATLQKDRKTRFDGVNAFGMTPPFKKRGQRQTNDTQPIGFAVRLRNKFSTIKEIPLTLLYKAGVPCLTREPEGKNAFSNGRCRGWKAGATLYTQNERKHTTHKHIHRTQTYKDVNIDM